MHAPEASTSKASEAAIFKRLHPTTYLRRFIAAGLRPDGRTFDEARECTINAGSVTTADGSALVRLGETTVVCGLRVEVAEPDVLRPRHGFIVPNIDLSPLCSPRFRPGPPSDEAQLIADRLHKLIQAANLIPLKSLCIEPGKAVYVLYLDFVCINYDGNIVDAALLAANATLRTCRIPAARWDEDEDAAVEDASAEARRPPIPSTSVLSASFAVFEGTTLLADPDAFEESLCGGSITVAISPARTDIVSIYTAGSIRGGTKLLRQAIGAARERCKAQQAVLDAPPPA